MRNLIVTLTCLVALVFSNKSLTSIAIGDEYPGLGKQVAGFNIWPGTAPGEKGNIAEEKSTKSSDILRIENVSVPTLTIYRPDKEKETGACVMVCPGGGYNILAYDYEGTAIAGYFNSIGVTAAVLKYRVPRREGLEKHVAAFQDAQRGIRILRSRAVEWGIDPHRIGVLGFSASGHLAMMTATHFDENTYPPVDAIDQASARPDFVMPIYPAYMMGDEKERRADVKLSPEITIRKDMPPVFISVTDDDENRAAASARVYAAMKEAGVLCELHIFIKGGHGYGMKESRGRAAKWDILCTGWLKDIGIIPSTNQ